MRRSPVPRPTDVEGAIPDAVLIDGARRGDRAAFDQLITRYQHRTYRLALRLTGNGADAEEVTQDAFLQVFRKLTTFRGRSRFSTWLYRVVTNAALMHRRTSRRRPTESLDQYLPEFTSNGRHKRIDIDYAAVARVEDTVKRSELTRLLFQALSRLPPGLRVAVVLRDLEEVPAAQVAAILGIDERALRQRVHRARLMLRGVLGSVAGSGPR